MARVGTAVPAISVAVVLAALSIRLQTRSVDRRGIAGHILLAFGAGSVFTAGRFGGTLQMIVMGAGLAMCLLGLAMLWPRPRTTRPS